MKETLDIATMPIADKVQRHVMASYYALQLDALQVEAKRLGYFFAQARMAAWLPPILAERLAWATEYRRRFYLFPSDPASWERQTENSMSDGYAQEHCRSILAALDALGIRLQESHHASALLAAEECRQREKAYVPRAPSLPSEDEFFAVLDAPKGDATP